ncbi:FtsK/SpoIIIE domain-containing protein [Pseudonocardia sp. Cha107L01]|uniref:FtsK/SpoIIIE domain-containing protein n=1 Tax=Pseudonocardia sp. Cha107L01 TaxID=3457576 RepID=UPI00403E5371
MTALEPYEDDQPMPVDLPERPHTIDITAVASRVENRRPVLPPYLRNRVEFLAWCRWQAQYGAHTVRFHGAHSPLYLARLALWTPIGLYRAARSVTRWVFDAEAAPVRHDAVRRNATAEYMSLSRQRNTRARQRGTVALIGLLLVTVGVWVFVAFAPPEWMAAGLVTVVGVLGKVGAPGDRRVTDQATVSPFTSEPLRADVLTTALQSLGIAAMSPKQGRITYPAPIRDIGSGWLASVDLPAGVTAEMVADRRPQLASGLRRPISCCWPEADQEAHGGRLELTVLKVAMSQARPVKYPLRDSGLADIFGVLAFGTDQRGRPVKLPLIESNMLIGSLPGAGKTASLRTVLAGCALDPTAELDIWELKGSGDLESFERIAHAYGSGVDDQTIEGCLNGLRLLLADLERRAAKLKQLRTTARDLVPDSKVTRELANRRTLGLFPKVFVVDEAQELFSHGEFGKEAGQLATAIIKRGRALGVILILATQRPDKDSLPTGVSANVGTRFCLRVMGQVENDMVLGTSSYKSGIRATHFTRSDRGIGYLVGATDAPVVTRSYYLDAAATDSIVSRAYLAREKAGLLTGQAAGESPEAAPKVDLLADVRTAFAMTGGERMWHSELLEVLAELRPAVYGDWDVRRLGVELRELGVPTVQVAAEDETGERVNRRGLRREDLEKVLSAAGAHPEIEQ